MPRWGRMLSASARVWTPTVLAVSAAQTLLVLGDPVPSTAPVFIGTAILSGAVFAVGLALVARALLLAHDDEPVRWRKVVAPHPALWWAAVSVLLVMLVGVLSPYLTVIGLVVSLLLMPPAASGRLNVFAAGLVTVRRSPVRFVLHSVSVVFIWALGSVGMLMLGFFVTGPASVAATWLVLTFVGAVVLASWTELFVRTRANATSTS